LANRLGYGLKQQQCTASDTSTTIADRHGTELFRITCSILSTSI